jgi:hypothetical protein
VVTVIDALTSFRDVEVEAEWNSEKGGRLAVGTRANSAGTGDLHKETVEQVDDEDGVMTLAGAKVGGRGLSNVSCERCQQMILSCRCSVQLLGDGPDSR